jgi:hypothetical protein
VYESVAGDRLSSYGYDVLPERPRLSVLERCYFDFLELKRLLQVNLYHLQNKLPGDTKRRARATTPRS